MARDTRTLIIERYTTKTTTRYRLTGMMRVTDSEGTTMMQPYEGDPLVTSIKFDELEFVGPVNTRRGPDANELTLISYSQDRDMRSETERQAS